jgi:hypothetical protein
MELSVPDPALTAGLGAAHFARGRQHVDDEKYVVVPEMLSSEKVVAPDETTTPVAPRAPAAKHSSFASTTCEDLAKRKTIWYAKSVVAPGVVEAVRFSSLFLDPPSTADYGRPGYLAWYGRLFRWWRGPLFYVFSATGANLAPVSTVVLATPADVLSVARYEASTMSWLPGAIPVVGDAFGGGGPAQLGDLSDAPLIVQAPGQHMSQNLLNLVPRNSAELAASSFGAGTLAWDVSTSATIGLRIYVAAADGFKFVQPYRVPYIAYREDPAAGAPRKRGSMAPHAFAAATGGTVRVFEPPMRVGR